MQQMLFDVDELSTVRPFKLQLLKWVGNKQRFAHEIASYFPAGFGTYFEPFLGSGAVLGTLASRQSFGTDAFVPLIEIWNTLREAPEELVRWYTQRWDAMMSKGKVSAYEEVKASYNKNPNGADLLFLSRSCYGGVVRFRKDGFMSTPCGVHRPISPASFQMRVQVWHSRVAGARFECMDYREAMSNASRGDLIYCDPPYSHTQKILYGAQSFDLGELFEVIEQCRSRGVFVALSIDGTKKSGTVACDLSVPEGLFEREAIVNCGRSMLRRFQMDGQTLESEEVADRLMLTY